jgi:hypothetical protein
MMKKRVHAVQTTQNSVTGFETPALLFDKLQYWTGHLA